MANRFQIPRVLQQYCDGRHELRLHGATLREAFDELNRVYPQLYQCLCNETGAVRKHINIFVNNSLPGERNNLDTRLEPDDVILVFQAVSGG
jgi:sulfur-carrier protein